jgi:hypothetical protein
MDDQSLKRELESALNVDPSPEFLARVRTRVAAEPTPARWRLAWVMTAATVGAVAIATTVLWLRLEAPVPPGVAATPVRPPALSPVAAPVEAIVPDPVARASRRVVPATPPRAEPEVMISEGERRGFETLLAALRNNVLPPVPAAETAVAPVLPVEIEAFTIEPLQMTRLE